jgi:hypothetical protein
MLARKSQRILDLQTKRPRRPTNGRIVGTSRKRAVLEDRWAA